MGTSRVTAATTETGAGGRSNAGGACCLLLSVRDQAAPKAHQPTLSRHMSPPKRNTPLTLLIVFSPMASSLHSPSYRQLPACFGPPASVPRSPSHPQGPCRV